jgi:AbrB family looped-hinge helix DNA binding protein
MIAKLDAKGRVTVPRFIRIHLALAEGDPVMFRVSNSRFEAIPMALVPRDQVWFYAYAMQERVAQAEADIDVGRTTDLQSWGDAKEFLDDLKQEEGVR